MGWEPAGARRGNSGSAGSPGSRGGSSDNPRDPSPTPGTGASPSSVTPALLPRLVPGRPAAQRRLASHHRMARARLRRRPPGRAAQPQGSRARRARGRSRRCRLSAGFPSWPGLLLVPGWPAARGGSSGRAVGWRGRRAAGRGGVPGVQAPSAAAGGVPGPGGGICAPGADRSFGSGSANPRAHLVIWDRQERYPGWDWVSGMAVGCLPAGARPGVLVRRWPNRCARVAGCRYSPM